ncbi:hypothetical protein LTR91_011038 [Friedmanniomyces endolithicus]|uniref:Uncharacterized protein n=1 Tax=Friedmanniomyces endolithicus TaxID=329885 RepID=A0A4U0UMU8_9PEZI|nr:hypothetical protein LTS09_011646 [Friedmanniomyces endolithicus]KAK0284736.1 hypothetical protein LTR35_005650 [Friedmanniomyces endolithicus]KAK0297678.1 hypothetical protein LTS00_003811 [Friedmanniomyces endolithicus]KAK0314148.1 hypothetical protein LTR82_013073 [Friedmanniomyces endolithicus]KAK0983979.1 hypothetical protein LTR91_011038 [Friedmanniomyces endolithicus]
MNFDVTDELELYPAQPWGKLEDILTVWIEVIQRSKIRSVPSAGTEMTPRKAVSWTPQDLGECVELWGMIVETVERKMELEPTEALVGVLDAATLDAARVPAEGSTQNFML